MNSYYFFVSVGVLVSVLPFLGVPQGFKNIIFTFVGLLVVFVSQKYIKKYSAPESNVVNTDSTNPESTNHSS